MVLDPDTAGFPVPLDWRDAGTVSLDDAPGLGRLWATWQANVDRMAARARARGWECRVPACDPGLPPASAAGQPVGTVLPAQLAWAMGQAGTWHFHWRTSPQDTPRGELSGCLSGGIRGTVWCADTVAALRADDALMSWAGAHAAACIDDDRDAEAESLLAFWRRHLAFHALPNGDMLALDLLHAEPQRQPVRYFSHEGEGLHGRLLAPDFFGFISRWTALGCVGAEWWSWVPFTVDSEPDRSDLDPSCAFARRWVAWLDEVPAHAVGRASSPDSPPPLQVARSAADAALLAAARDDDLAGVEQALRDGAQPDCSDPSDWQARDRTAVMHAVHHGNLPMLQRLLDHGASLATHVLPLANAMLGAPAPALAWLIAHGARIDPWTDDRFNALHRLYDRHDLPDGDYLMLLDAMLAAGADPDVFHDTASSHALTTLLMRSGPVTARRLLAAGADPLLRDAQGRNAMHFARDREQVRMLLDHGLDVNDLSQPDDPSEASRPLHFQLSSWSVDAPVESVSALLEAGADPALPDGQGRHAWWHCRHMACAEWLARTLPFDPAWRDAGGGSPLHHLVAWGSRIDDHSADLLTHWCEQGLDINAQDGQGDTALHLMARCYDSVHDRPSMDLLLRLGADWRVRNRQGQTPRDAIKKKHRAAWKPV